MQSSDEHLLAFATASRRGGLFSDDLRRWPAYEARVSLGDGGIDGCCRWGSHDVSLGGLGRRGADGLGVCALGLICRVEPRSIRDQVAEQVPRFGGGVRAAGRFRLAGLGIPLLAPPATLPELVDVLTGS